MFCTFQEFLSSSESFISQCEDFILYHGLERKVIVDHICYKCDDSDMYDCIRKLIESDPPSAFLYQLYLSGRRVAYLGLRTGIPYRWGTIQYVELADKKTALDERTGFHHVEIYPSSISYGDLVEQLERNGEKVLLKTRPHHTTHDIIYEGAVIRLTDKPLLAKIVGEQLKSDSLQLHS